MLACPRCGQSTPEQAKACPFCGALLPERVDVRTVVGYAKVAVVPQPSVPEPQPPADPGKNVRTLLGMPSAELAAAIAAADAADKAAPKPAPQNRTMMGMAPMLGVQSAPVAPASQEQVPAVVSPLGEGPIDRSGRTLMGVARPGIAPLRAGAVPASPLPAGNGGPPPPNYAPAVELGSTIGAVRESWKPPAAIPVPRDLRKRMVVGADRPRAPRRSKKATSTRRPVVIIAAAGALAVVGVVVAVAWPSAPPIRARARADAQGREGVEVECASCPDGTKIAIGSAVAVVANHTALVPLATELSVGDNRMKVAIDRPGNGRDETVGLTLNVGYRIRPDLGALQADHPALLIVAEAARGTSVVIDGKPVALTAGRGVVSFDVTESCVGDADELRTLSRQIPYVVTRDDAPPESGSVSVSVGIVPLFVDAPGPRVTTDQDSFVLAGRTVKGAEVIAAGASIPVRADGSFAQVMKVSSEGSTEIEVRAKMANLAPRLYPVKVRRVEALETAAKDFATDGAATFSDMATNPSEARGKPIILEGEIVETRSQGYRTILLMNVGTASGCSKSSSCTVRLVVGAKSALAKGDSIRAFGRVAAPFPVAGQADLPQVEVDFSLNRPALNTGTASRSKGSK